MERDTCLLQDYQMVPNLLQDEVLELHLMEDLDDHLLVCGSIYTWHQGQASHADQIYRRLARAELRPE